MNLPEQFTAIHTMSARCSDAECGFGNKKAQVNQLLGLILGGSGVNRTGVQVVEIYRLFSLSFVCTSSSTS